METLESRANSHAWVVTQDLRLENNVGYSFEEH